MNLSLLFNTLSHLRIRQILYQLKYRFVKEKYKDLKCPMDVPYPVLTPFISKYKSLSDNTFSFLNLSSSFSSWNDTSNGMLWAYNLNYMDGLLQKDMPFEEGAQWIDRFIKDIPENRIGLDPYPIALRGINWIKFQSLHKDNIDEVRRKTWNDSLYSQYKLLEKKLEYHLLGNHLLEDAYSLFIAAIYFQNVEMYKKASKLLLKELEEQTLEDGAHYEQSPMYHCILLDRLLDCYNIAYHNVVSEQQEKVTKALKDYCIRMLGHLENILYQDGSYPLFNDSALGIAPAPSQLFDYAERLGLKWTSIPLKDSGYRKLTNPMMEAFVDVGNITATYQPGHTHADTFNYELRINGLPLVVDTGISTYNKTSRRQYERSTEAHNCVVAEEKNSSDVWGGFRVGKRCRVYIIKEKPNRIEACHNGFKNKCYRTLEMTNDSWTVEDKYKGNAVSYIHLAPEVKILSCTDNQITTSLATIHTEGAGHIEWKEEQVSSAYNTFNNSLTIKISFKNRLTYRIHK